MSKYKVEFTLFDPQTRSASIALQGMLERIIRKEVRDGGNAGRPGGYKEVQIVGDTVQVTRLEPTPCIYCNGTGEGE